MVKSVLKLIKYRPVFPFSHYFLFTFARYNDTKKKQIKIKTTYMFENLSDRLERSFKILKGEGKITEINVAETLKDVRRALLDADVNYKVAKTFTEIGRAHV